MEEMTSKLPQKVCRKASFHQEMLSAPTSRLVLKAFLLLVQRPPQTDHLHTAGAEGAAWTQVASLLLLPGEGVQGPNPHGGVQESQSSPPLAFL